MAGDITLNTIALQTAIERLRQERETFNQRRDHEERWFSLRLRMGYAAAVMLPAIGAAASYIALEPEKYTPATVGAATVVLFTDVIGLLISVWKVVMNPASAPQLSPVTTNSPSASPSTEET